MTRQWIVIAGRIEGQKYRGGFGYKPGSIWTTDPLFMKVGTEYYFYHNDHLGTPQKLTTISGAVVWSAKYSSFGKAQVDPASTVFNNLRFPGQYFDSESGLHYNWYRYYAPETGRYFRPDPKEIELDTNPNLFCYSGNNPVGLVDPNGLESKEPEWGCPCNERQELEVKSICNKSNSYMDYCRQISDGDTIYVFYDCKPWKEERPIPDPEVKLPLNCMEECAKIKSRFWRWLCYLGCYMGETGEDH